MELFQFRLSYSFLNAGLWKSHLDYLNLLDTSFVFIQAPFIIPCVSSATWKSCLLKTVFTLNWCSTGSEWRFFVEKQMEHHETQKQMERERVTAQGSSHTLNITGSAASDSAQHQSSPKPQHYFQLMLSLAKTCFMYLCRVLSSLVIFHQYRCTNFILQVQYVVN